LTGQAGQVCIGGQRLVDIPDVLRPVVLVAAARDPLAIPDDVIVHGKRPEAELGGGLGHITARGRRAQAVGLGQRDRELHEVSSGRRRPLAVTTTNRTYARMSREVSS